MIEGGQPLAPAAVPGTTQPEAVETARVLRTLAGMTFETEEQRRQAVIELLGPIVEAQLGRPPTAGAPFILPSLEDLPASAGRRRLETILREFEAARRNLPAPGPAAVVDPFTLEQRAARQVGGAKRRAEEETARLARERAAQAEQETARLAAAQAEQQQAPFAELARRSQAQAQRRTAI